MVKVNLWGKTQGVLGRGEGRLKNRAPLWKNEGVGGALIQIGESLGEVI